MRAPAFLFLLCCSLRAADGTNAPSPYDAMAKDFGWTTNLNRGREISKKIASLTLDERPKLAISAYRGERVAFVGVVASPGSSNDLLTSDGFYLRVVNRAGKDLRPHSVWWEVMVYGKISQVIAENKLIVIEVDEKDWKIIQTG
jgi:hypothetical protein